MRVQLLAAPLAACISLGVIQSAPAAARGCDTPTTQLLDQATMLGWTTKELTGEVKKVALKNLNATPPVTHLNPARLFITALPETDERPAIAMLIFADKRCVTDIAGPIPMSDLVTSLAGTAAPGDSE